MRGLMVWKGNLSVFAHIGIQHRSSSRVKTSFERKFTAPSERGRLAMHSRGNNNHIILPARIDFGDSAI